MHHKRIGFWIVLAAINLVGLGYAISLFARASSENRVFATFVLLAMMLLLAIADIRSVLPH
jgi:predicted membrane channel-forming protein YqfA (hemolysin III family)